MEKSALITTDILTDEEINFTDYTYATKGQRLINFVIDNLVMRFTITYVTTYGVIYLFKIFFVEFMVRMVSSNSKADLYMLGYVIAIFNYIIYYTLLETLLKGQSIGKMVTGTKALKTDGGELTFKDALLRSLCRLIPLEIFSGFGILWHDAWTHTMVVKK